MSKTVLHRRRDVAGVVQQRRTYTQARRRRTKAEARAAAAAFREMLEGGQR